MYWRNTGLEQQLLTPEGRETILRDHFGSNSTARFFNQAEMNWIDIRWHGNRRSYALSLKTRYASRFEIGRGLFSLEGAQTGITAQSTDPSTRSPRFFMSSPLPPPSRSPI